jgi:ABC-2 type transport system ATP-binding protein
MRSVQAPLEIKQLVKHYGPVTAVDGVSLAVKPGEVFGLLGPNGAGKTSIISILTTLETATSGEAQIFGERVGPGNRRAKGLLGCVPQEIVSHGFFSVEEVMRFHSGYYGIADNHAHIDFLLRRLGLYEHRHKRVRQLSGGMKRRLLIAKALVHRPRLLLLDEPTAGVDVELRTSLWAFVRELNRDGVSVLLTTHYLEEAETLCHRVGILHHGRLRQVGETKALVKQLTAREITLELRGPERLVAHPRLVAKEGNLLRFQVPNDVTIGDLLVETRLPVEAVGDVHIREGNLEDAFRTLLGEVNVTSA